RPQTTSPVTAQATIRNGTRLKWRRENSKPAHYDNLGDRVSAELLGEDGSADEHKIDAALRAGQTVLRPELGVSSPA
ncbi:hypothetical protein ACFU53_33685, partial [Streptomyces sp. NPDC057474]|uniref:hypothetical protein n=1 Tax=Streptomyces sp. NPDC057474 TaxID=3346144 RepID=UPI003676110B